MKARSRLVLQFLKAVQIPDNMNHEVYCSLLLSKRFEGEAIFWFEKYKNMHVQYFLPYQFNGRSSRLGKIMI